MIKSITSTAIIIPIVLVLFASAIPLHAQSQDAPQPQTKSITLEQLRINQKRASLYMKLGYSFNPSTTSAEQMDRTVTRGQRAKFWKTRGFTFDPLTTSPEEMDRHAYATQRAQYWERFGYTFDPEKMNSAQMDLYVLDKDPDGYWKRLGIQYDAALLDKTKTQLLISSRITAPSPAVRKQHEADLASQLEAERNFRQRTREDLKQLTDPSQTKTPEQRLDNRLAEEKEDQRKSSTPLRPTDAIRDRQSERTRIHTPATRLQDAKKREPLPGQRVTVHTPNRNTFNERRDTRESTNKQTVRTSLMPFNERRDLRDNGSSSSRSSNATTPAARSSSSSQPYNARRASRDNSSTP